jgi:hypothetical protein
MFIEGSRYFAVKTVETETEKRVKVSAVTLRRLPYAAGSPTIVNGNDRLDIIAQRQYSDGTMFWHIADANSELEANILVTQRVQDKEVRIISVPEK